MTFPKIIRLILSESASKLSRTSQSFPKTDRIRPVGTLENQLEGAKKILEILLAWRFADAKYVRREIEAPIPNVKSAWRIPIAAYMPI